MSSSEAAPDKLACPQPGFESSGDISTPSLAIGVQNGVCPQELNHPHTRPHKRGREGVASIALERSGVSYGRALLPVVLKRRL